MVTIYGQRYQKIENQKKKSKKIISCNDLNGLFSILITHAIFHFLFFSYIKVRFWEQTSFYGVDFSPLVREAREEIFGQPIVGTFDQRILAAAACPFNVDFKTLSISQIKEFEIPICWTASFTGNESSVLYI